MRKEIRDQERGSYPHRTLLRHKQARGSYRKDVLSNLQGYMKEEDISDSVWKMVLAELKSKEIG